MTLAVIEELEAELYCALRQSLPSDDQIVVAHVRKAHAIALRLLRAARQTISVNPHAELLASAKTIAVNIEAVANRLETGVGISFQLSSMDALKAAFSAAEESAS